MIGLGLGMTARRNALPALLASLPSLDLDFLSGVYQMSLIQKAFSEIFTFSRASSATRINSAGLLETVAANVPRFDYEPADVPILGAELITDPGFDTPAYWSVTTGWSISGSRLVASSAAGGSWAGKIGLLQAGKTYKVTLDVVSYTQGQFVVTLGGAGATSGPTRASAGRYEAIIKNTSTTNTDRLFLYATGATPLIATIDNISVTEVNGYTVRKGDPNGLLIEEQRTRINTISLAPVVNESVAVTAQPYTLSFYGAGTVTLSGAHVQVVSGAGAFPARKTYTFTPVAGTLTMAYSGSCQDVQVEAGAFATSVIRGEGAQVSRAADVCSINTLSPWFKATDWTLYSEFDSFAGDAASIGVVGADTGGRFIYRNSGSPKTFDGTTQVIHPTLSLAALNKYAVSFSGTQRAISANGSAPTVGASAQVSPGRFDLGAASGYLNGHLRKLRYYPKLSINAALQALTA